jgi:hypothetical protein
MDFGKIRWFCGVLDSVNRRTDGGCNEHNSPSRTVELLDKSADDIKRRFRIIDDQPTNTKISVVNIDDVEFAALSRTG